MRKVIWFTMVSLDGFVSDRRHDIAFHAPGVEVHQWINQLNEANEVMLLDRAGYALMKYWDQPPPQDLEEEVIQVYAKQWQRMHKIVVDEEKTLPESDAYTLWQELSPDELDRWIDGLEGDVVVGSVSLAWALLRLKRIDEIQMFTVPMLLGAGEPNFEDCGDIKLALLDHKAFETGWIYLHYRVRNED